MRALIKDNPDYAAITLMRVDWNQHRGGALVKALSIPRQSTLVAFKGGKEVARAVARTGRADLEALLEATL